MPSQLEPEDIVECLKLCLTRRKLTADVDAALRDAISEIERLREVDAEYRQRKLVRSEARKAAKREKS
jgi:hypothetical protein